MGYTAVGEHVGLAQRMESTAPPGGVMLSESTSRLVQHAAVLGEPEMVRIKGSDDPVPARRLLGMETPHAVVGRGESRLVGRRWEIAAVEANLERSIEGDGAAVALVGPAGIGKSRLVREIVGDGSRSRRRRLLGILRIPRKRHSVPRGQHGSCVRSSACRSSAMRRHGARLRAGFDDADEQDLVLLDDLLGIRDPDTPLPNIDPDARRRRLSALVKAAAIARSTPAVYIVEDVHWIDDVERCRCSPTS